MSHPDPTRDYGDDLSQYTIGRVSWFNDSKGYGLIDCPERDSIFVHYTAIETDGFKTLVEGQWVDFILVDGPKGPQATNVHKIKRKE